MAKISVLISFILLMSVPTFAMGTQRSALPADKAPKSVVVEAIQAMENSDFTAFRKLLTPQATINGTTPDVNYYNFAEWGTKLNIERTKKISDETTAVLVTLLVPDSHFLAMRFEVTCISSASTTPSNSCKISYINWNTWTCPGQCTKYWLTEERHREMNDKPPYQDLKGLDNKLWMTDEEWEKYYSFFR